MFHSVPDLIGAIEAYLAAYNQDPKPFVWTAEVDNITDKIARAALRHPLTVTSFTRHHTSIALVRNSDSWMDPLESRERVRRRRTFSTQAVLIRGERLRAKCEGAWKLCNISVGNATNW